MPTGYTEGVQSGRIKSFREYAWQCARAFGACIHHRDDPADAKPTRDKASTYHKDERDKSRAELKAFQVMSNRDRKAAWSKSEQSRKKMAREQIAKNKKERERYEEMLAKARAFSPPTEGHAEFAKFIVSQLENSIQFDCGGDYWERQLETVPFEKWQADRLATLERSVAHHAKEYEEELTRVDSRNAWLDALEKAIAEVK